MKKYSSNSGKLYESESGFQKIENQKTYTSKKGNKYTVNSIYIDAESMKPEVKVVYDFETEEGQKGSEENSYTIFVDMLRNS